MACDRLTGGTPVEVSVAGEGAVPGDARAVMVSINVSDPASFGFATLGSTPTATATATAAVLVLGPDQPMQASMIVGLSAAGTFTIGSSTGVEVTVDVVGWFTMPTNTYSYEYGPGGLRSSKQREGTGGWRREFAASSMT